MLFLKRSLAILFSLLALMICFTACEDKDNNADGNNGVDKDNSSAVEYYINYNGTKIELGAKADGIVKALGVEGKGNNIGDCGGLGAQVRYNCSSFVLYVLETDSGNTVDQISFNDDLVQTPKGICIGSAESDIREAYGEPDKSDNGRISYIDGNKQLLFEIENGKVKFIDLMCVTN